MNILLADDHYLVRETIAAFLTAEGFRSVSVAASLPRKAIPWKFSMKER